MPRFFTQLLALALAAGMTGEALSMPVEGTVTELAKRQIRTGRLSWQDFETGNAGACGRFIRNSEFAVAISPALFSQSQCGKIIQITANGRTAQGVVLDSCPTCTDPNNIDLTPGFFQAFANLQAGVIQGSWQFV
ncbi:hypothetical protein FA15DRAFT_267859 [Coprinopsis marcescibilis]|uniref:RlpA-like protein double-psi beta-barrel domain-containing protein n=1 Tax=Coprinopsis marcescibilis TaxID=230819 RepID=A0A5C3KEP8_COPMA|nr:hypothetical protein FA15DRAFT_267859 [Coprinopsis marcescibilis]